MLCTTPRFFLLPICFFTPLSWPLHSATVRAVSKTLFNPLQRGAARKREEKQVKGWCDKPRGRLNCEYKTAEIVFSPIGHFCRYIFFSALLLRKARWCVHESDVFLLVKLPITFRVRPVLIRAVVFIGKAEHRDIVAQLQIFVPPPALASVLIE
uniref:Uncharacterized protein TCIL3000_8_2300 n=1 Tax=Trypanosoma congolense (strain IL3000) TaxID=1068625 RepID=G0URJ9_TRYCI|nr:unnamed protein product [Trypanosoma congolense IL3000]